MKKCNLCNSDALMESVGESRLIPGAKYVNCCSCGNMMILSEGVLIPTPQADNEMTKAMIEDAANCFLANYNGRLMAASLTGKNCETHVQPTAVQQLMQNYVGEFIEKIEEAMNEDCDECEEECSNCCSPTLQEEQIDMNISLAAVSIRSNDGQAETKSYLLVRKDGNKQIIEGATKLFITEIINTIEEGFVLYEINEITPKTEVKYSI